MKRSTILSFVVAAATATTAVAGDKAPDPSGTYKYAGSYVVTITSPQKSTSTDNQEGTLTVTSSKKGGYAFTFTAKGETCHLNGSATATGVKFASGQTCSQSDDASGAEMTITLVSGSGTVHDDSMTLNMAWKLSGSIKGVAIAGKATETVQAEQQ